MLYLMQVCDTYLALVCSGHQCHQLSMLLLKESQKAGLSVGSQDQVGDTFVARFRAPLWLSSDVAVRCPHVKSRSKANQNVSKPKSASPFWA